jgi:hypothetical protein
MKKKPWLILCQLDYHYAIGLVVVFIDFPGTALCSGLCFMDRDGTGGFEDGFDGQVPSVCFGWFSIELSWQESSGD